MISQFNKLSLSKILGYNLSYGYILNRNALLFPPSFPCFIYSRCFVVVETLSSRILFFTCWYSHALLIIAVSFQDFLPEVLSSRPWPCFFSNRCRVAAGILEVEAIAHYIHLLFCSQAHFDSTSQIIRTDCELNNTMKQMLGMLQCSLGFAFSFRAHVSIFEVRGRNTTGRSYGRIQLPNIPIYMSYFSI